MPFPEYDSLEFVAGRCPNCGALAELLPPKRDRCRACHCRRPRVLEPPRPMLAPIGFELQPEHAQRLNYVQWRRSIGRPILSRQAGGSF